MKKAMVTGAAGFIGRFLVRELAANGVAVWTVGREGTDWRCFSGLPVRAVECDLADISALPELIADREIDCVFHLAWQGVSDADAQSYAVQLSNVRRTLELMEAAHEMGISSFVMAGSIHEYEAKVEMASGAPVHGQGNMYKTAKLAAHWMGKTLAGKYAMRFLCPLIINAYGEEEHSARLINSFVRQLLRGESPSLSSGEQLYDFVHVSDVARALYLVGEKGIDGRDYSIGSGRARPLRSFLTEAGEIVSARTGGEKVPLGFGKYGGKAVFLPPEAFDTASLTEDTGFRPAVSFREGIERTIDYIRTRG